MADKDSTTITNAATMADADLLAGVQGGNSRDFPGSVIKTYVTPTNAETKTAYEANADTNVFDDAAVTKLAGIETAATADQTGAEIKTAYEGEADTNAFTDAEQTKLSGIETAADVTDSTNVNAAGATMNTDADVSGNTWVLDEDDLTSDSATKVATQQSVKAYVDANAGGGITEIASKDFGAASATTWDVDVTGYDVILISVQDLQYDSTSTQFLVRVSTDGVTFDSGASDYWYGIFNHSSTFQNTRDNMELTTTGENQTGEFTMRNLASSTFQSTLTGTYSRQSNNTMYTMLSVRQTAQVDTHIRFLVADGGDINGGRILVQGL